jgi:hypothetical protein
MWALNTTPLVLLFEPFRDEADFHMPSIKYAFFAQAGF